MEIHILFAKLSWYLLIFILLMRPVGQVFNWKFLLKNLRYRKHLGIACGLAAILHVGIYLVYGRLLSVYFFDASFWSLRNLFGWGNLALLALLIPFATSNKASQKFFKKRWKTLQKFSYPALILTGVHVALSREEWLSTLVPISIWAIFWFWAWTKSNASTG
jgi:sulfoxide reductase heme-binding subunit YedZ